MIWKRLAVLAAAAVVVIAAVVGLAQLIVPDEPTFTEGFEEANENPEGSLDFVPTAIGGELQVSGAREGTITLESNVSGPGYGLTDGNTRIFFEPDPLTLTQMSHDGLAFFPEPEDCELTEGQHNEEARLAAVQMSCPELVDIRDNGSLTVEGYLALPSDLVLELDRPDTGGEVTVGETQWELSRDPSLFIGPESSDEDPILSVHSDDTDATLSLHFAYDRDADTLSLTGVSYREQPTADVAPGACSIETDQVAVINPQTSIHEMTLACDSVDVPELGTVPIEGTIVFEKFVFAEE